LIFDAAHLICLPLAQRYRCPYFDALLLIIRYYIIAITPYFRLLILLILLFMPDIFHRHSLPAFFHSFSLLTPLIISLRLPSFHAS